MATASKLLVNMVYQYKGMGLSMGRCVSRVVEGAVLIFIKGDDDLRVG